MSFLRNMVSVVFITCLVIFVWYLIAEVGYISTLYLPHPADLVKAWRQELLYDTLSTASRALLGYVAGILLAYFIHGALLSVGLGEFMDAQFASMRAVPTIAVMPLFVIWFGFSEVGRILIVTLAALVFYLAPLNSAFLAMKRERTILYQQLQIDWLKYYTYIVIPETLTSLGGALRVCMAISFTIAVASEYIGAQHGIGKFLDHARVTFNVPAIFLAIIFTSVTGLALDKLVKNIYYKVVYWHGKTAKV
jgi:ABC-type nitrate/sulfonate/bicarbonate transport system permease component